METEDQILRQQSLINSAAGKMSGHLNPTTQVRTPLIISSISCFYSYFLFLLIAACREWSSGSEIYYIVAC